jgi:uncharacterized membrane protein
MILLVNLICHLTIFSGALYVATYNKRLPQWHVTPLWYAGMACLLTALTIVFQFLFGASFPLAYDNVGIIGETSLNICLATVAGSFFYATHKKNKDAFEEQPFVTKTFALKKMAVKKKKARNKNV